MLMRRLGRRACVGGRWRAAAVPARAASVSGRGGDEVSFEALRQRAAEVAKDALPLEAAKKAAKGGATEAAKDEDAKETAPEAAEAAEEAAAVEEEEEDEHAHLSMKPRETVGELDRFIVGQSDAKRSVAIAMRNRWRRHRLQPPELAEEVMPKNILMIGPTGVGKTEIARRLAKIANAPFLKVEATKFTETGFHGRDVDQIIRDLVTVAINNTKQLRKQRMRKQVERAVEDAILRALLGPQAHQSNFQIFRDQLRAGLLEKNIIEVELPPPKGDDAGGAGGGPGSNPNEVYLQNLKQLMGQRRGEKRKITIEEARPLIEESETERMVNTDEVQREALRSVEQDGIVFIDEIDKICTKGGERSTDASAEGVQRDLLPLIEGSTINTKFGNVDTDHILFIASGAFHAVKPSDLLAELQGRLPIRVELKGLTEDDLYRILTEPEFNLVRQQKDLMRTEGVELEFTDAAVREIARVAAEVNLQLENIGARRLHTIMERIMDEVSFDAPEMAGQTVVIDPAKVKEKVSDLLIKTDLSKYVL